MSHVTETLHVRGVRSARVQAALDEHLRTIGFERVPEKDRARVEKTEPQLRRIALRRTGQWTSVVDTSEGQLDGWAEHLSRALARSVLAIWTWDGEASVIATRWKNGKARAKLTLLRQAFKGRDGRPHAPSRVLWPWLPPTRRDKILREGIKLVETGGSTGDEELDTLLEGFDDADREEAAPEGEPLFVSEEVSVIAIGACVGLTRPFLDPWSLDDGDRELVYRPSSKPAPPAKKSARPAKKRAKA